MTITDKLPPGLNATAITGQLKNNSQVECTLATLTCTFKGVLYPYEQIDDHDQGQGGRAAGTVDTLPMQASVEGGGAREGLEHAAGPGQRRTGGRSVWQGYELAPFNEDGTPATQAGAHPSSSPRRSR